MERETWKGINWEEKFWKDQKINRDLKILWEHHVGITLKIEKEL